MEIKIAGYNTDVVNQGSSPETISAAYARISRDPRPAAELRAESVAEVEKARSSNRTIIFKYGHGSVAEHAVFNFDILGISRFAAEELQDFRLVSFTEKSQRYVKIGEEPIIPPELDAGQRELFRNTVSVLHETYETLYLKLVDAGCEREVAREDSRYVLPLATSTQMGMTVNARELEHIVRRLSANPFTEVRELARKLLEAAVSIAPSLFLFFEPTSMDRFAFNYSPVTYTDLPQVCLIEADDDARVGSYLIQMKKGISMVDSAELWKNMSDDDKAGYFTDAYEGLGIHDALPRCWELFRADFEIVLSASAYAQLKRHRFVTRMRSVYDPALGITVPPSISQNGFEEYFRENVNAVEDTAGQLDKLYPYLLTNAHRRRIVLSMNGRELYHFSRLREDVHAQWDIRSIAGEMLEKVRESAPLTMMYAGGKSEMSSEEIKIPLQ